MNDLRTPEPGSICHNCSKLRTLTNLRGEPYAACTDPQADIQCYLLDSGVQFARCRSKVVTKEITVSASQLATAARCLRKWAWDKISGVPREEKASTIIGSHVHAILEAFFAVGKPIDKAEVLTIGDSKYPVGRTAISMVNSQLPPPKAKAVQVEHKFEYAIGGVKFLGFIDLRDLRDPQRPLVVDHKTSSNPQKWGKREEDLDDDPQANLYGWVTLREADALCEQLGVEKPLGVRCLWNYGSTRGTLSHAFTTLKYFSREQLDTKMQLWIELAKQLTSYRYFDVHPLLLEPNTRACDDFGGCSFKHLCHLTQRDRTRSLIMGNPMDSLNAMKQQINSGQMPPQMPGQMPPQMPPQMPGQMPPQMPGQMPPQMPGQMPPQMPGQMPTVGTPEAAQGVASLAQLQNQAPPPAPLQGQQMPGHQAAAPAIAKADALAALDNFAKAIRILIERGL